MEGCARIIINPFIMFSCCKDGEDCCKDLKTEIKNNGDKLVVTISGDKDKLAKLEKKLGAMKTLCCD
jgi:hypothetical protein